MSRSLFAPDGTEVSCRSLALALVVLAAFIHATWNLLSKRAAEAGPAFVFAYNLFACIVYLPWVIWLLVYGDTDAGACRSPAASCSAPSFTSPTACACSAATRSPTSRWSIRSRAAPARCCRRSARSSCCGETPSTQGIFGLLAVVAGIGSDHDAGRSLRIPAAARPRWRALGRGHGLADRELHGRRRIRRQGARHSPRRARLVLQPAALLHDAADRAVERPRAHREPMKGHWLLAHRRRRAVAAVLHPRAHRHRDGRPAQPRRARARNVDDGRRDVRHADPRRGSHAWRVAGCLTLLLGVVLLGLH